MSVVNEEVSFFDPKLDMESSMTSFSDVLNTNIQHKVGLDQIKFQI